MFPGINPKQMQHMMKKMGIAQMDIDASEVIIKTPEKNIIIRNPSVAKVKMQGQETFQISGDIYEESAETAPEISEEDIKTVAEQAGVSEKKAKEAIEAANGDLAEAILNLTS